MPFCPKCGAQVPQSANFCPNCGQNLAAAAVASGVNAVYTGDGYAVMLVSAGTASAAVAADLISDACGYTDAEALTLVANAPTLIAQSLTKQQAVYLAQCMTEYGLEAAIFDRTGSIALQSDVDSVFDGNGSFLAG
ncbi:MAG: zinc ribbon domain-containing protein, partial [Clostridia bacterium]|nr:zinc ribbon domain-containing protein [Clostridia bacterium]